MKLLNPMPPYTLFGVDNPEYSEARIAVLPVPYDSTTSYKAGARDGPHAIIDASRNMELYSEELGTDISSIGIYTLDELMPNINSAEEMVRSISAEVSNMLESGKVPLTLGGEHTVAVGPISAMGKTRKDFTVLHFDAHSDSRDTYMGSKYSHACIMSRAREITGSGYSVGVRSTDEDGAKRYSGDILFRRDMHNMERREIVENILEHTREKIYITIDVDVLDPGEMPSTGTPEPDGLSFHELTSILKGVLARRELLGLDFTELSPIGGIVAPNFLVAKLAYMTLGYAFCMPKETK